MKLLKELHESMLLPMMEELRDALVYALVKLQNDKFTLIMTSLADLSPEDSTFLPSFVFTTDELAEASGIDRSLIDRDRERLRAATL